MTRRPLACLAALLAAVTVLAGCTSSSSSTPMPKPSQLLVTQTAAAGFQGVGVVPPRPRPSFTLTDTTGKSFSFGTTTAGHPTLLYFGYTQCPDICPATMADIALGLKALPLALQKTVYVVFVSTDVKNDTAPIIAKWLSNFTSGSSATWVGLRGTQAQVDTAQAAAHIFLASDAGQTHSAQALLFGADDYARDSFVYNDNGIQGQVKHDVPLVASA